MKKSHLLLITFLNVMAAESEALEYTSLEKLFAEPVTTSVTGSPQRVSQVPATMEIITAADIRRSGAKDIPGVLRHVIGIDVLQWTRSQFDIGLRGYNQAYSPRILVLIDGRQVYADYYGYTPWSAIPIELSEIRQIEIVKGPNSALFGFNAVSGVINIITFNPLDKNINRVTAVAGSQHFEQGSGIITKQFGRNIAVRIAGGKRLSEDFTTPIRAADARRRLDNRRTEIHMDVKARLNDKVESSLTLSTSNADQAEITPLYSMGYMRYHTKSVKFDLSADTNYGLIKGTIYKNWISAIDRMSPPFTFINEVTVANVQDVFKIASNHTFNLSTEFRHNAMPTTQSSAHVFYTVASLGLMWNWQIIPSLSFTNAFRFDHVQLGRSGEQPNGFYLRNTDWNNHTLNEKSFNSGLVWEANKLNTFRMIIGRGIQLPNMVDLGGSMLAIPSFFIFSGIPYLNPTTVMNYELSWDRILPMVDGSTRVSIFHQNTHNIVANTGGTPPAPILTFTPRNIGDSNATGIEFTVKGKFLDDGRWGFSYAPQIIHDHFNRDTSLATSGVDFKNTAPAQVVLANIGWAKNKWELDTYLRYQSSIYSISPNFGLVRVHRYFEIDGRAGYRFNKHIALSIAGQNLTHTRQKQTSGPAVERQVLATLVIDA